MADEIKQKVEKFFIPKVNHIGIGLQGARAAGEIATIAIGKAYEKINPVDTSELGTPVYSDVTFQSIIYTDNNGNVITTPEMTFQAILLDVVFPRNIIKTVIQGRNGTVKEYIGEGDAEITFRGVITSGQNIIRNGSNTAPRTKSLNGVAPKEAIIALQQIITAPCPIPVISWYLNNLNINSVVFEARTLGQEEGGYSYQQFSLAAISDTPQELIINGK